MKQAFTSDRSGESAVVSILPSGRVAWLRVSPALATSTAVDDLRRRAAGSTYWRAALLARQRAALGRLVRAIRRDERTLSRARLAAARRLRRTLTGTLDRTEKRLLRETEAQHRALQMQQERHVLLAQRLERRDLWDKIVLASAAPLFAAFANIGNPFGTDNLTLALSLLVWLAGDEVADAISGVTGDSSSSSDGGGTGKERLPEGLRELDIWSYLAPAGNLLSGWWLLHNRQHERFITGFAELKPFTFAGAPFLLTAGPRPLTFVASIDLLEQIAPDYVEDFEGFTGVPAVASVRQLTLTPGGVAAGAALQSLTAVVDGGALRITASVTAPAPNINAVGARLIDRFEVAWIVDTNPPPDASSTS